MAGEFVKHDLHTREVLVTEICSVLDMKVLTSAPSPPLDSVCFTEKIQEVPAVSNILARVSACQIRVVTEDHTDSIVKPPPMIRLFKTKFLLPLLLSSKPVSIVTDTQQEVDVKEPEMDDPSAKLARLSYTTHPVA